MKNGSFVYNDDERKKSLGNLNEILLNNETINSEKYCSLHVLKTTRAQKLLKNKKSKGT